MALDTPQSDSRPSNVEVSVAVVAARCLRCNYDISNLPEAARFCPRCGLDLLGSPPASLRPYQVDQNRRMSGLLGGWEHLFHIFQASGQSGVTHAPSPDATSLVVQGYGNALYRMGRRYEYGGGGALNPREALRCYSKSARLGNFWAMARLASQVFSSKAEADESTAPGAAEAPGQLPPSAPATADSSPAAPAAH